VEGEVTVHVQELRMRDQAKEGGCKEGTGEEGSAQEEITDHFSHLFL
jgi:hypothetical protein